MLWLTFVETRLFTKLVSEYWEDEEYAARQVAIAANPQEAPVVPGTGGVRKLRWRMDGRGKRSGVRVIYYVHVSRREIWMLTAYPKNVRDTIPAGILRAIREELHGEKPKRRG